MQARLDMDSAPHAEAPRRISFSGNAAAWLGAVAAVWIWVFWVLSTEWRYNAQYQFGFLVPFLAGALAWQRWNAVGVTPVSASSRGGRLLFGFSVVLFIAGEWLHQHDPIWRLGHWLLMAGATLFSLAFLSRWGGAGACRTFAAPLAFLWIAVPWPAWVDALGGLKLQSWITSAVVNFLNLTGIAALRHGNLIETENGILGIDIPCSGVESLQSSLMATLFLGAIFRWNSARRLALVWDPLESTCRHASLSIL